MCNTTLSKFKAFIYVIIKKIKTNYSLTLCLFHNLCHRYWPLTLDRFGCIKCIQNDVEKNINQMNFKESHYRDINSLFFSLKKYTNSCLWSYLLHQSQVHNPQDPSPHPETTSVKKHCKFVLMETKCIL